MALFEFECIACGKTAERLALGGKKARDVRPRRCPKCASRESMKLKLGPSSFKLCGVGFHANDYPKTRKLTGSDRTQFAVGSPEGGKK